MFLNVPSRCVPFLVLLPVFRRSKIKIRGTPIIDHFVLHSSFHPLPRTLLSRIPFTYLPIFPLPLLPPRYCTSEPEGSLSSVFPSLREKKRQIRCNKICWLCTRIHIIITHRSCASPAYIPTHSHTTPVYTTTGNARRQPLRQDGPRWIANAENANHFR